MIVSITKWAPDPGEGILHRLCIALQANIILFFLWMKTLRFRVVKEFVQGHTADMWCVAFDLGY